LMMASLVASSCLAITLKAETANEVMA